MLGIRPRFILLLRDASEIWFIRSGTTIVYRMEEDACGRFVDVCTCDLDLGLDLDLVRQD
jgi:hypothetical protein